MNQLNEDSTHFRKLTPGDLGQVSRIHSEELPDDFISLLGETFLRDNFYPGLLKTADVALCGVHQGTITGFVVFSSDETFFSRLALDHWSALLRYSYTRLLQLKFLRYLFEVLLLLLVNDNRLRGPELVYIAVSRTWARKGLGSAMTRTALLDLHRSGVEMCWVKTLKKTPQNISFYESMGFQILKTYLGRTYMTIRLDRLIK